jgi:hypothetical protein
VIERNVVRCKHCHVQVESENGPRVCRCGRVSVFGGTEFLGRIAESEAAFIELSLYEGRPSYVFQAHVGYRLTRKMDDCTSIS